MTTNDDDIGTATDATFDAATIDAATTRKQPLLQTGSIWNFQFIGSCHISAWNDGTDGGGSGSQSGSGNGNSIGGGGGGGGGNGINGTDIHGIQQIEELPPQLVNLDLTSVEGRSVWQSSGELHYLLSVLMISFCSSTCFSQV